MRRMIMIAIATFLTSMLILAASDFDRQAESALEIHCRQYTSSLYSEKRGTNRLAVDICRDAFIAGERFTLKFVATNRTSAVK